MFVVEDLALDVGCRAAQARFGNLLHGNWLGEASKTAYEDRVTGLLRVGPARPLAAKLVRVSVLDPVYRGDVMTVALRWEATGSAGALFPVLDADISIAPLGEADARAGDRSARIALSGVYRPPLGRLGAGLDQVVLHRVASATMRTLLHSIANAVTNPGTAGEATDRASPGMHPVPQTEMP
jgi:hypothetical protein